MSRYIDADDLRHRVLYFSDARNLNGNHEQAKAYNHCLIMIDESKTVDVVRCKDCKFQKVEYGWNCKRYKVCINFDMPMDDEDFCSWGERREDGEIH